MAPECPEVLFCRFPRRFRDFREGFGCFRRSFGPRGPSVRGARKPPRSAHSPPPGYVPAIHADSLTLFLLNIEILLAVTKPEISNIPTLNRPVTSSVTPGSNVTLWVFQWLPLAICIPLEYEFLYMNLRNSYSNGIQTPLYPIGANSGNIWPTKSH